MYCYIFYIFILRIYFLEVTCVRVLNLKKILKYPPKGSIIEWLTELVLNLFSTTEYST